MIRNPIYKFPISLVVIILTIILNSSHAFAGSPQTTTDNETLQEAVKELITTVKQLKDDVIVINNKIKEITKEQKQQKDKKELEDRLKQDEFDYFWEDEFLTFDAGLQFQYIESTINCEYDDAEILPQYVFGLGYHLYSSKNFALHPYFQLQGSLFGWDDFEPNEVYDSRTWSLGFIAGLRFDVVINCDFKFTAGLRFSFNYIEENIKTKSEDIPLEESLYITRITDFGVSLGFSYLVADEVYINVKLFDVSFKPGYFQYEKILYTFYVYIGVEFCI